jgi:OPA family sugar phosphate sensor protein UhpC-like MFS transporter
VTELTPPVLRSRYERWRWQIFAVTWLAYVGFYLTRRSFAVTKIELGSESGLGLSMEQMAWIDGAFLVAYAVGQFFWGVGGDRYGTRRVVLVGMLGSAAAAMAMGAASSAFLLAALFGLQGLCQSSGWAPLNKNIGHFFSRRERGTIMGLWSTNYALGGFVGAVFAAYFGSLLGWRYAFFVPAGTLLVIWLLFLIFQRNKPEDVGLPPVEEYRGEGDARRGADGAPAAAPEGSWAAVWEVLTSRMVWLLAAVYFFIKPTRYAIVFWAPKYLNEKLGTDMLASGALGSLFELAGPLGMLAAGVLSDRLFGARRNPIAVIALFLVAGLVFALDRLPASGLTLGACLFAIGFLLYAPDSLVSGTAAVDFGTKKGASTAVGLINGCGSLGAIVGGTLPGLLHDRLGWDGLFQVFAGTLILAGCLLLPKWNARPAAADPTRRVP